MKLHLLLRDLFRRRRYHHPGTIGMSYGVREYTEYPKSWKPWFTRFVWYRNLHPWIGGDEWCRWTLVVPLIYTSMVIPLWACRDPNCEACLKYCDLLEVTDDSAHG